MSALVLLSGGMDSTIAYYHTLHRAGRGEIAGRVHAITFNYGQRHAAEVDHAGWVYNLACGDRRIPTIVGRHRVVTIPNNPEYLSLLIPPTGSLMGQESVRQYKSVEEAENAPLDSSFIPYRNLLFLTLGAMWGRHWATTDDLARVQNEPPLLVTGIRGGFPDCTEEFEQALQRTMHISNPAWPLQISSPVHISRADSIRLAQTLPGCMDALAHTMTCFEGKDPPCGKCLPCLKRAEGFAEVGIGDPALVQS